MMKYKMEDPDLSALVSPEKRNTAVGEIEFAEMGEGPAVIALHGAMGGYDQGLILAQTVAESGYRFIAVSRPGYLGTPLSSGKSPEAQGDLMAALLDSLHISHAGVLAVSGGGPAAIQFGLRHGDRCRGLVLISTYADKMDMRIPFSFKIATFLAGFPRCAAMFRKKAQKDLKAVARRSVRDPEIFQETVNDPEIWPLFSAMLLRTYERMDQRMEGTKNDTETLLTASFPLEKLDLPVLVVHGTQDPLLPHDIHVKMFGERIPGVEIFSVEGGEHVAVFTHREEIREKVSAFMQRNF